mgnify:CR=1 FL=1
MSDVAPRRAVAASGGGGRSRGGRLPPPTVDEGGRRHWSRCGAVGSRFVAHAHAGGDHPGEAGAHVVAGGSSPRRRGPRPRGGGRGHGGGLIPAQAGTTGHEKSRPHRTAAHPRAGGDHVTPNVDYYIRPGSSPRRRGPRTSDRVPCDADRPIPAQAGTTAHPTAPAPRSGAHPHAGGDHDGRVSGNQVAPGSSPRRRGPPPSVARPCLLCLEPLEDGVEDCG